MALKRVTPLHVFLLECIFLSPNLPLLLDTRRHRATAPSCYGKTSYCCAQRPQPEYARPAPTRNIRAGNAGDVEQLCLQTAEKLGLAIDFRQTNIEGELISWVQDCRKRAKGIIINPAGYTHTSIALLDALLTTDLPVIEVHISNIHRREPFRHHSYVSRAATGVICGLGVAGYSLALQAMTDLILNEDD